MSDNSVSKTAYYCCGVRLQDAESSNPVCGDNYAKLFMDSTGKEIHDPAIINELGIPDNCTIVAPIILGYPEKIPAAPKRKEAEILKIIT